MLSSISADGAALRPLLLLACPAAAGQALADLLSERFASRVAVDSEEALAVLRGGEPVAAALLDAAAPAFGLALLPRLAADVPVLALTSAGDAALQSRALEAGAADVLTEPFCPDVVRRRVENILQLRPCGGAPCDDYRAAMDGSALYLYVVDPRSHRILYRNDALRDALGITDGDVCYRCLIGRDEPCEFCPIHAVGCDGGFLPVEIARRDGLCVLAQASSVHWNGEPAYMIACTDITRRRETEEALRVSAAEHAIVIKQSGKSAYRYDIATDTAVNLLDADTQLGLPNVIEHFGRAMLRYGFFTRESEAAHRRFLRAIRRGDPFGSNDVLLKRPDGSLRWYHADFSLVRDPCGNPTHAIISFFDNTVQREKELAYEKWQTKLDALLTQKTPYLEVNLTRDAIVRAENLLSDLPDRALSSFSAFSDYTLNRLIDRVYIPAYRHFFDRERLLGLYCAGQIQDSMEYLASPGGSKRWYRIEVQLVKYPVGDDIKAFILFTDIDAEVRERKRLETIASTDKMTGLLNRDAMKTRVDAVLRRATVHEQSALFMVDLDNFKTVNDTLGHRQGDAEIVRAAEAIRGVFRGKDLACRIGGDEFMVFMNGGATLTAVQKKAAALLAALQGCVGSIRVSASVGIALIDGSAPSDFGRLYEQADRALYAAKRSGKNNYSIAGESAPEAGGSQTN